MLQQVQRCLDALAAERGGSSLDADNAVYLDDSKALTQGSILLIFEECATDPAVVVRAAPVESAWLRQGKEVYRIEFENLERLEQAGVNARRRQTPCPLGLWIESGTLVTVQSALPGSLMKNRPGRDLFGPGAAETHVLRVVDWWRHFQKGFGVRRRRIDEQIYRDEVLRRVELFEQRFVLDPDEARLLGRVFRDASRLLGQELPFMVRHGDFCTANIMLEDDGIGVFDWEFPLEHHFPLFDLLYFFASTRFPFRGLRGESGHFDSFKEVFWGRNHLNEILGKVIRNACRQFEIPTAIVPDLFVLSLIEVANLKYEALFEVNRIDREPDREPAVSDAQKESRWRALGGSQEDVPMSHIRACASETVRFVARAGTPPLFDPRSRP